MSPPTLSLFADEAPADVELAPGAHLLRGFARDEAASLWADALVVAALAPFRHMTTPGGFRMSAAMTNCGALGWVSDRRGYRYTTRDPHTDLPWPPLPHSFLRLAARAAERAGFSGFVPDACLVNRYAPGAKMSLHQDKNEPDVSAPIVSVSLGLQAVFLFGGDARSDPARRVPLQHGDVLVWGGPARLRYHGVATVKADRVGDHRINLTLRKAAG